MKPRAVRAVIGAINSGVARGAQVRTARWTPPNAIRKTRKVRAVWASMLCSRAKFTSVTPNAASTAAATTVAPSALRVIRSGEDVHDDDRDVVLASRLVGLLDQGPDGLVGGFG